MNDNNYNLNSRIRELREKEKRADKRFHYQLFSMSEQAKFFSPDGMVSVWMPSKSPSPSE